MARRPLVVLVSGAPILTLGLRAALADAGCVVAECPVASVRGLLRRCDVDAVVVDLGTLRAPRLARAIARRHRDVRVVGCSVHLPELRVYRALRPSRRERLTPEALCDAVGLASVPTVGVQVSS